MCEDCKELDIPIGPQGIQGIQGPEGPEGPQGPIGDSITVSKANTETIKTTITHLVDDYEVKSDVKYEYSLSIYKSIDDAAVNYLPKQATFTSPLSNYAGGKKYSAYTATNDTVTSGGTVNALPDFNKTTGVWTCPSTGYYTMSVHFGYNTPGAFVWLTGLTLGIIYNYLVNITGNNIWGISEANVNNTIGVVTSVAHGRSEKMTAGQQIGLGYGNLSDADLFGTAVGTSGVFWVITKVSE